MASHEHSTITLGNELNKGTGAAQKHYHTLLTMMVQPITLEVRHLTTIS